MKDDPFMDEIKRKLAGAHRIAIVGIGDECSPVDRLGMVAAKKLGDGHVPQAGIFLAGTVPESITAPVRRYDPDHILLLDAADMGKRPGTIAIISPGTITGALLSTHALPLAAVMEFMAKDTAAEVTLLGIQPDLAQPQSGPESGDREFLDRNLKALAEILKNRQA